MLVNLQSSKIHVKKKFKRLQIIVKKWGENGQKKSIGSHKVNNLNNFQYRTAKRSFMSP